MANKTITPANFIPSDRANYLPRVTWGESVTQGQPVYKNADGRHYLADANDEDKLPVLGVAATAGAIGQPGLVVSSDPECTPGFAIAAGEVVIVSATAGEVAPVGDAASGDYVSILYVGIGSNKAALSITSSTAPVPAA